ncbi:MAG: S41 family peptidase [Chthonomonadales bacterium]
MVRAFKGLAAGVLLALVIGGSFATGRHLRYAIAGPVGSRVTALPGVGIGSATGTGTAFIQSDDASPANTFQDVYTYVKQQYVDRVENDEKLSFGAVRSMLAALDDPKTRFYDPAQKQRLVNELAGNFSGIGAILTVVKEKRGEVEQNRLAVVAPVPGGPADRAGIRPGDVINYIDKRWVIAYDPRYELSQLRLDRMNAVQYDKEWKDATKRLADGISLPKALDVLSSTQKPVNLVIERAGSPSPISVTVDPGPYVLKPAEYRRLNDHTGYLRITEFNDAAGAAIREAAQDEQMRGLVVDLRGAAEGPVSGASPLPQSAQDLLAAFTRGGVVANLLTKGSERQSLSVPAGRRTVKLAVLINRGTANIAEVVAAALKERGGAVVIGSRSFGDAVYQRLVPLRDDTAMTVTAGKFLTATGGDFGKKGIAPDVAMAVGGPQPDDAAVRRAVGIVEG